MAKPPFVMSKYMSKEELYKDKADYYQTRCRKVEVLLKQLRDQCIDIYNDYEEDEVRIWAPKSVQIAWETGRDFLAEQIEADRERVMDIIL